MIFRECQYRSRGRGRTKCYYDFDGVWWKTAFVSDELYSIFISKAETFHSVQYVRHTRQTINLGVVVLL